MKLMKIFEEVLGDIQFTTDVDDDNVTINAIKNRNIIGKISFEFVFDAYREFEDLIEKGEMTDQEYESIFPNDRFVKIDYLNVIDGEKGKGYAKQLMQKAISYAKEHGETVMYLNASPMGFSGLNINDLTGFYNTFGFQTLVDSGHNVEMYANI
jgi:GNAT superfamily N-acetyltransferase